MQDYEDWGVLVAEEGATYFRRTAIVDAHTVHQPHDTGTVVCRGTNNTRPMTTQ
jgi:hypothetical protein